ncbi:hypothetical protein LK08_31315 [Streptomyces sp. MUSC 125]|uniref:hypothetical protein n=1 Tax=Streptomyces sp. MUSC 125 TaxID=1428624 RepID=UPI00057C6B72|nr:hypothetical protein [Streptomyces sp. MUSC 125]KIE23202.1 hypothetical protein LK08_31315 [Streptomyces sp. MUSC 125]
MATAEGTKGRGRVTVFSMFGPVFGYASTLVDDQQVAYIGPLTPTVNWRKLWQMAECCHNDGASETRKAQWIVSQASRAFICGSDVVVKLPDTDWEMEPGGWLVELGNSWCNQDVLVTGNLTVPDLTAEQIAPKFTYYPQYAG